MPASSTEFFIILVIGSVLALMLVGFIVTILLLYQRRQQRQEKEMEEMRAQYDKELLRAQLEMQEATLKEISQELHDNIGQVLSVVKLTLAGLPLEKEHRAYEPVQGSRQMLNKAIADLADLNKSLHTDRIANIGLTEAIRFNVESIRRNGLVEIDMETTGLEYFLEEQKQIFLFRMYQEVINNILKHAKARRVKVRLDYDSIDKFAMIIRDDGVGFDVASKKNSVNSKSGVGLKSLYNRAQMIGGEVDIQSKAGEGTTVKVELPVELRT